MSNEDQSTTGPTDQDEHGPLVSRRAALTTLGVLGLTAAGVGTAAAATAAPAITGGGTAPQPPRITPSNLACVLTPEQTEGPYYLPLDMVRHDITEDYPGVPLILRTTVVNATTCRPIKGAALDIWHCSAVGVYSGYSGAGGGPGGGGPGPAPSGSPMPTDLPTAPPTDLPTAMPSGPPPGGGGGHAEPTDDLTFLRGVQLTDHHGVAEFRTIYPGWYQGRTIHIHVKVHIGGTVIDAVYTGGHVSHTGQFYFPEETTEQIALLDPYNTNTAVRTTNEQDGIFIGGGSVGLVALSPPHHKKHDKHRHYSIADGLVATIIVGVDPDATPSAV